MNSFSNQFELPVLFYVLTILAYVTHHAGILFVVLAWVFVIFRLLHAYVHVTSNIVRLRGAFFGVSAVALAIMWIDLHRRGADAAPRGSTAMPLDYCHPTAPHKKLRLPEWYVSSLMMDRALDAICRRVKKLDRNHDIPYLAGYSQDGKTIYIDRHMPKLFKFRGRTIDTDRFLILHEEVEKTLIDQLGLHYLHAHQIATRAEEAAVRAAGITWRKYDRFMQKYVKHIGDERLTKVPKDLDLKPYRDEHDDDLLRRMLNSVHAGKAPKGFHGHDLAEAIRELRQRVRWHDTPGAHRAAAAIKAMKNAKKKK